MNIHPTGMKLRALACASCMALCSAGIGVADASDAVAQAGAAPVSSPLSSHRSRPGQETRAVRVAYHDLDLSTPAGVEALYARLQRASRNVCRSQDIRVLANGQRARQCYAASLDVAVERANDGSLASLHQTRTGRLVATAGPKIALVE